MSIDPSRTDTATSDTVPPPPGIVRHVPEFRGSAGEFFSIWIVNLVLTVLTLGIYSAWAKVRTQRYFYGNTRLAGASFEFLADPIRILKGRLIAYAFVLVLAISAKFEFWWVFVPMYVALLIGFPWLILLGLRFRARYSAWRGLRFGFDGKVGDAYVNFMLLPIAAVFTLYLLIPWVSMQQQQYVMANHRLGRHRFGFQGEVGRYYIPFFIAFGIATAATILFVLLIALGAVGIGAMAPNTDGSEAGAAMMWLFIPVVALFYAAMLILPIYLRTKYLNLMWGNTQLGPHRFECTLRVRDMLWIYFSNGLAILFSLGLAVPWAMVRMTRYRLAHLSLLAAGSLDAFVAEAGVESAAAGAELVDALDLDVDIGL
jgi:uncharacterized membrane protein YjgN (DUF898 family)